MEKFEFTKEGSNAAFRYLIDIDKMKDIWIICSTHDIIIYANKVWKELNSKII